MVGKPSWRAGNGWEALTEGREWLGMVGRPSQKAGSIRKSLPKDQEWSGGPHGGSRVVRRHSWKVGSGS